MGRALAIFLSRNRGCVSVCAECASIKTPMGSPKWSLWNHSRTLTDREDVKCEKYEMFYAEAKSSLRGRVWEGECQQSCVEQQSESLLHKGSCGSWSSPGARISEGRSKEGFPLTITVPDLVRECRKWRWCQTHSFSTLPIEQGTVWAVGKSRGLHRLSAPVCVRAQAEWAESSLNSSFLGLCCTWRPGRTQRGGGPWVCDHASLAKFVLLKGDYWWQSWLCW